ncbi:MAG: hypothetical protein HUU25_13000 [Candidatus Sumerlaeia bacterium]|nr:hypothetical protein [Candidatus Sumerlaeia bacterium]
MLPLSLLLLGSPPATAEDPQDPPPAITEVYRVPDAEAPSGEVRLVQVGSEEDPRSTLLVETGAGLQVVEVGLDGAHATPLGLTTSPRPGKGLRRVDDLYWFGGSLAAVVRGSGQVYSRSAGEPASPPLALGLRGLEQVFFLDQYVIGVRGTRIASLDLADGSTARRDEPALKEANRLCVDPTHGFAIYGVGTLYLDPGSLAPAEDNGLGRFWQEDCWPRPSQFRRELPSTLTSGGLVTGEVQEDHLEVALRSGDGVQLKRRLAGGPAEDAPVRVGLRLEPSLAALRRQLVPHDRDMEIVIGRDGDAMGHARRESVAPGQRPRQGKEPGDSRWKEKALVSLSPSACAGASGAGRSGGRPHAP